MSSEEKSSRWYALRVKSNFESQVALSLRSRSIEEFLPSYKTRSRWSDRFKEIQRPLFPGYLFSYFQIDTQLLEVVKTPGIVQVVSISKGSPTPISQSEIDTIRRIVESTATIKPHPYLNTGDRVRIKRGPLAGLEGILTEFKKQYRLVVSVSMFARSLSVDLESDWIERG